MNRRLLGTSSPDTTAPDSWIPEPNPLIMFCKLVSSCSSLVTVENITYPANKSGNILRSAGNNIAYESQCVGTDEEPAASKDVGKPTYGEKGGDLSESHRENDPDGIETGTWSKSAVQIVPDSDSDVYQFLR